MDVYKKKKNQGYLGDWYLWNRAVNISDFHYKIIVAKQIHIIDSIAIHSETQHIYL